MSKSNKNKNDSCDEEELQVEEEEQCEEDDENDSLTSSRSKKNEKLKRVVNKLNKQDKCDDDTSFLMISSKDFAGGKTPQKNLSKMVALINKKYHNEIKSINNKMNIQLRIAEKNYEKELHKLLDNSSQN